MRRSLLAVLLLLAASPAAAQYLGDAHLGDTLDCKFLTNDASGTPYTLAGSPVISAYVDNGTTEITAGITLTTDFDSRTGLNNVRVVASSGNGFAAGSNVHLVITTGTVNGGSVVGYPLPCSFSIDKRPVNLTQIDGLATNGNNATLNLKQLNVVNNAGDAIIASSTGSNGNGINASGNVIGAGLKATGGSDGSGVRATGGGTAGHGLYASATAAGGYGIRGDSSGGSAAGIGANGTGSTFYGIIANGALIGFSGTGGPGGAGIEALGSGAGSTGFQATGGTSGDAVHLTAGAGDGLDAATDIVGGVPIRGSITGNLTGNVGGTINGLTATALADFFDTDSGTTYASAVAGSVVKEIASNAGGGTPPTAAAIADAVWDEAQSGHTSGGSFGKFLDVEVSSRSTFAGGAVSSVTGNVGGNVTGSVGSIATGGIAVASFAAGAIDAAAIATDAIGSAEVAATAVTKIQSGLATSSALTTVQADTDDIQTRLPAALTGAGNIKADALVVSDKTGYALSAAGVDAVWDEVQAGHVTAGTFGKYLDSEVSAAGGGSSITAADVWDYATASIATVGSIGKLITDDLDATVSSRSTYAGTDTSGTTTLLARLTNTRASNLDNLDAAVSSRSTYAGGAVASVTTPVTVGTNSDKTGYALSAGGVQAVWDAQTSALTTSGSIGKLFTDNLDATISSRSTYGGVDTSGTTTLLSRLTSGRATLLDNLDAAITTRSTYAGADTSGTTTLLGRLTNTRAGLIDNLDVLVSSRGTFSGGAVASVTTPVTVGTNTDKTGYSLALAGWDTPLPVAAVTVGTSVTAATIGTVTVDGVTISDGVNSYWRDALALFTGAGCNIVGQVSKVISFNGTTRVLTWSPAKTAAPNTSCFVLLVNR